MACAWIKPKINKFRVSYRVIQLDSSMSCSSLLNPVLQIRITVNVTRIWHIFVLHMVATTCCDAVISVKWSWQWHVCILILIRFSMCNRTDNCPRGSIWWGWPARLRAYSPFLWRLWIISFLEVSFIQFFIKELSFSHLHEGDLLIKLVPSSGSVSSSDMNFSFKDCMTLISFLAAYFTLLSNN